MYNYDAIGQLIFAQHIQPGSSQLQIETAGIYLIQVVNAEGKSSQHQLIVQQ